MFLSCTSATWSFSFSLYTILDSSRSRYWLQNSSNLILVPSARKSSDNKIPEGVVPVPNKEQSKKSDLDEKIVGDDVKNALPNRYQNNIIENERANEERAEQSDRDLKLKTDIKADEAEKDNGANEVFDLPAIVNEKSKNDARHIDVMGLGPLQKLYDGQDPGDYDKEARDVQQEENEPEEDGKFLCRFTVTKVGFCVSAGVRSA